MEWYENLAAEVEKRGGKRDINRMVDGKEKLYLERYYLQKDKLSEWVLHRFFMGDVGPVHDHPWPSTSIILACGYREHVRNPETGEIEVFERHPGYVGNRSETDFHKVELRPNTEGQVWTLFGTGIRTKGWGFLTDRGWVEAGKFMEDEGLISNTQDHALYSDGLFPVKIDSNLPWKYSG